MGTKQKIKTSDDFSIQFTLQKNQELRLDIYWPSNNLELNDQNNIQYLTELIINIHLGKFLPLIISCLNQNQTQGGYIAQEVAKQLQAFYNEMSQIESTTQALIVQQQNEPCVDPLHIFKIAK